jgi:hypothetical protein
VKESIDAVRLLIATSPETFRKRQHRYLRDEGFLAGSNGWEWQVKALSTDRQYRQLPFSPVS